MTETETVETTGGPTGGPAEDRPRRRRVAAPLAALLVLVTAAVAAYGVLAHRDLEAARAEQAAGDAAVRAAGEEALLLFSLSAATSAADVEALLDGATADFRGDLEDQAQALRDALEASEVTATGEIDSAALIEVDGDRAQVLVAASQVLDNAETEVPEPRYYRVRVGLERVESRWLVASLEFVG